MQEKANIINTDLKNSNEIYIIPRIIRLKHDLISLINKDDNLDNENTKKKLNLDKEYYLRKFIKDTKELNQIKNLFDNIDVRSNQRSLKYFFKKIRENINLMVSLGNPDLNNILFPYIHKNNLANIIYFNIFNERNLDKEDLCDIIDKELENERFNQDKKVIQHSDKKESDYYDRLVNFNSLYLAYKLDYIIENQIYFIDLIDEIYNELQDLRIFEDKKTNYYESKTKTNKKINELFLWTSLINSIGYFISLDIFDSLIKDYDFFKQNNQKRLYKQEYSILLVNSFNTIKNYLDHKIRKINKNILKNQIKQKTNNNYNRKDQRTKNKVNKIKNKIDLLNPIQDILDQELNLINFVLEPFLYTKSKINVDQEIIYKANIKNIEYILTYDQENKNLNYKYKMLLYLMYSYLSKKINYNFDKKSKLFTKSLFNGFYNYSLINYHNDWLDSLEDTYDFLDTILFTSLIKENGVNRIKTKKQKQKHY